MESKLLELSYHQIHTHKYRYALSTKDLQQTDMNAMIMVIDDSVNDEGPPKYLS